MISFLRGACVTASRPISTRPSLLHDDIEKLMTVSFERDNFRLISFSSHARRSSTLPTLTCRRYYYVFCIKGERDCMRVSGARSAHTLIFFAAKARCISVALTSTVSRNAFGVFSREYHRLYLSRRMRRVELYFVTLRTCSVKRRYKRISC